MSFPQYIHNQPQCESRSDHGQISTWTLWALRQWFSVWSSASLPSLTVTGRGTDQVRDEAVKIMYNITLISQLTMTTPSPGTSPPCQPPSWVISPRYLPSPTWLTSPPLSQSTGVLPALTTTTLSSQSALPGRTRHIWLSSLITLIRDILQQELPELYSRPGQHVHHWVQRGVWSEIWQGENIHNNKLFRQASSYFSLPYTIKSCVHRTILHKKKSSVP